MKTAYVMKKWMTTSGYPAMAILMSQGSINGYVCVQDSVKKEDTQELEVHGGVTFFGRLHSSITSSKNNWVGFDTAHLYDGKDMDLVREHLSEGTPADEEFLSLMSEMMTSPEDTFRDLSYVMRECESMASQLKDNHED